MRGILPALSPPRFKIIQWVLCSHECSHFTDEETEAKVTIPRGEGMMKWIPSEASRPQSSCSSLSKFLSWSDGESGSRVLTWDLFTHSLCPWPLGPLCLCQGSSLDLCLLPEGSGHWAKLPPPTSPILPSTHPLPDSLLRGKWRLNLVNSSSHLGILDRIGQKHPEQNGPRDLQTFALTIYIQGGCDMLLWRYPDCDKNPPNWKRMEVTMEKKTPHNLQIYFNNQYIYWMHLPVLWLLSRVHVFIYSSPSILLSFSFFFLFQQTGAK